MCPGVRGVVVVCCGVWVVDWEVGGFGGREVGAVSVVKIVILSVPEAWSMLPAGRDD